MSPHLNQLIKEKEASQSMDQALIIQIVNLIIHIIDIAFNHNSYSITFS